jgi:hypothetical protein
LIKIATPEVEQGIIADYLSGMEINQIINKYSLKTQGAIFYALNKHNVKRKTHQWSKSEIDILKRKYPDTPSEELANDLHVDIGELRRKASKLGISKDNYYYSDDEVEFIKSNFDKMSFEELLSNFPHKSESSLRVKLNKMELRYRSHWTDEEIELLRNVYSNYTDQELQDNFFKDRSLSSLGSMGTILGLKKTYSRREFTPEQLLQMLKEFADELGRTPTEAEISANRNIPHARTYDRYFGSYRKACLELGLPINYTLYNDPKLVLISSKGDMCLSRSELKVTEFLIKANVNYIKEALYKSIIPNDERCGLKRCDWLLDGNIIVEYFGMPEKPYYQQRMVEKRTICQDNNVTLIELYEDDLKHLKEIFSKYINMEQNP